MLRLPFPRWASRLAVESLALAAAVYLCSVGAAIGANLGYELGRVQVGPISLRLLGQALFIELPLLAGLLAIRSLRVSPLPRTVALALVAVGLGAVHVDAYYIEPRMIVPREYAVDRTQGTQGGPSIRILHLTDIQTPTIGAHEEDALRLGLSYKPDLIVMTGDYVQNALGRDTERKAARDLVALMDRIGFDAPLGVFATEGDVGPPCREVFRGVVCVVSRMNRCVFPCGADPVS